ncbi:hypothetical protein NDU88_005262 [Pleurodeles waltl]|uniref:Secreted protein n=1 Tax=Pleurodeles waltl TaxID=8319 RepID=A0AAV7TWM6_PLEWA|nr:hypothetical protein NDU88_005262 [Pleurodeles waltl]
MGWRALACLACAPGRRSEESHREAVERRENNRTERKTSGHVKRLSAGTWLFQQLCEHEKETVANHLGTIRTVPRNPNTTSRIQKDAAARRLKEPAF